MGNQKDTDKPQPNDAATERRYHELEAIYRTAPVGLGLVDRDLRYLRVNDRLAEFLGKPPEDIVGRTLAEVAPEGAKKVEPIYRRVFETREPALELEVLAATEAHAGAERHWLVSYCPVVSYDGEVVAVSSIIQDVTERTEAERALRVSEDRFRAFMDNSPHHIYMKDADRRHLYANRTLLDWLGITQAEFLGTSTSDFFSPDVTERVESGDQKCLDGTVQVEVVDLHRDAGGERTWIHDLKFPVVDTTGEMIIGGIATNITPLKNALIALEERTDFERLLSELAAAFVNLPIEEIDATLTEALKRVGLLLGLDRCAYGHLTPDETEVVVTHVWNRLQEEPTGQQYGLADHNWLGSPFETGEPVLWSASDSPVEAGSAERETMEAFGFQSFAGIPVTIGDALAGALAFSSSSNPGPWKPEIIDRLHILADIFGNVLARRQADRERRFALAENERLRALLEAENVYLREQVEIQHAHTDIVGQSEAIRGALAEAEQVAKSDSTVLLLGETGTGKELVARAIHRLSARSAKPLVTVNCAALPPTLIESELFGREKGAYTGALSRQAGRFEVADGSTIFLDEIGDLPHELQVKLLRVLETGEFERLGSSKTLTVDVRVIAATNRDLQTAVEDGRFREDLYYRLNVFPITVPPLRDRRDDIPLLVWAFVREFAAAQGKTIDTVPKKTMESLQSYQWPGNVRELRNVIERAVILSDGQVLKVSPPDVTAASVAVGSTMEEVQRNHILQIMEMTGWRVRGAGGAAEILDMKPTTLENRMIKLGIEKPNKP
jgi:PAS domain S-box-containing protein